MACSTDEYVEDVVCQVSDLCENEPKICKLKHGEVLLVKQNNRISAVGTTCTHYGGSLVNAALGQNRIRCPLHGSCYNLCSGDIEDFPGLDSLPSYQVSIVGTDVKVKAKASDLCLNKRQKPMGVEGSKSAQSVVIVGGGPAAAVCAETLRQEKFSGEITMICKENVLPYDRVRCSKQLDFNINDAQFRDDAFYEKNNITIIKGVAATAVDTAKKSVTLANGKVLCYNKLFVAVGFDPMKPDVPGIELGNITPINKYQHASSVNCVLSKTSKLVIQGCGFVGLETAEFCIGKVASITVLMDSDHTLLNDVFGEQIGNLLVKRMERSGVVFVPNVEVKQFHGSGGKVSCVETTDGKKYPADVVVIDIGWAANSDFLKGSGIEVRDDGTIEADIYLQCNAPDVYVGGDIATAPIWCNDNIKECCGHIGVAMHHGKVAGLNIAGKKTELKVVVYYWSILGGHQLRFCGQGQFDDIIFTGDVEGMKFIAYYISQAKDKVVGICSINMDVYVAKFAEMIIEGKTLKTCDICGGSDDPLGWAK